MIPLATSQARSIPEATLVVIEAHGVRREVPVTHSPFLIGRGDESENDLKLGSQCVSRHSSVVVLADGKLVLEDCGQKKGLFVNNQLIETRHILREGDVITF